MFLPHFVLIYYEWFNFPIVMGYWEDNSGDDMHNTLWIWQACVMSLTCFIYFSSRLMTNLINCARGISINKRIQMKCIIILRNLWRSGQCAWALKCDMQIRVQVPKSQWYFPISCFYQLCQVGHLSSRRKIKMRQQFSQENSCTKCTISDLHGSPDFVS